MFNGLRLNGRSFVRSASLGTLLGRTRRRRLVNAEVRTFARELESDLQDDIVVERAGVRLLVMDA
jgi:hypothetical protein